MIDLIKAKAKFEVGPTILHVPKLTREELDHITEGKPFEYWYPHEHVGKLMEGNLRRNSVIGKSVEKKSDGYYISVEVDVQCLSTSRKRL
jgi:hypothetical protein